MILLVLSLLMLIAMGFGICALLLTINLIQHRLSIRCLTSVKSGALKRLELRFRPTKKPFYIFSQKKCAEKIKQSQLQASKDPKLVKKRVF